MQKLETKIINGIIYFIAGLLIRRLLKFIGIRMWTLQFLIIAGLAYSAFFLVGCAGDVTSAGADAGFDYNSQFPKNNFLTPAPKTPEPISMNIVTPQATLTPGGTAPLSTLPEQFITPGYAGTKILKSYSNAKGGVIHLNNIISAAIPSTMSLMGITQNIYGLFGMFSEGTKTVIYKINLASYSLTKHCELTNSYRYYKISSDDVNFYMSIYLNSKSAIRKVKIIDCTIAENHMAYFSDQQGYMSSLTYSEFAVFNNILYTPVTYSSKYSYRLYDFNSAVLYNYQFTQSDALLNTIINGYNPFTVSSSGAWLIGQIANYNVLYRYDYTGAIINQFSLPWWELVKISTDYLTSSFIISYKNQLIILSVIDSKYYFYVFDTSLF